MATETACSLDIYMHGNRTIRNQQQHMLMHVELTEMPHAWQASVHMLSCLANRSMMLLFFNTSSAACLLAAIHTCMYHCSTRLCPTCRSLYLLFVMIMLVIIIPVRLCIYLWFYFSAASCCNTYTMSNLESKVAWFS
jgi:hypothetical protein